MKKEIELCEEGEDMPDLNKGSLNKNTGLKYEYMAPSSTNNQNETNEIDSAAAGADLKDLMSKLKSLWSNKKKQTKKSFF